VAGENRGSRDKKTSLEHDRFVLNGLSYNGFSTAGIHFGMDALAEMVRRLLEDSDPGIRVVDADETELVAPDADGAKLCDPMEEDFSGIDE
jgi:hypothetical protein